MSAASDPSRARADLAARNAELEREIAELRRSAQDLQRTQADLARAQRMARIGSWRWSIERNALIEGSEEYARIHGVALEEIHARMDGLLECVIHPDDRERVARSFREVDVSGESYEIEYRIIRPDGEVRYVCEIGEAIRDASGRPVEQVGTTQDVTDEKRVEQELQRAHDELELRVEERTAELRELNRKLTVEIAERGRAEEAGRERELLLRSAARVSNLGYAVWDERKLEYVSVSEEYARVFGLSADVFVQRFLTYEKDLESIYPEDRARYEIFDRAYRAAPVETQIEYRIRTASGSVRHVRELMQPIHDASGRLVQSIITIQDISDLKHTEEQLRQAQKMEAVGQLTGGVAHDFNNLLAVILGNLELVAGQVDPQGPAADWIGAALAAAERGANLTQRLLAFSRRQALRPEPVDAGALVEGMRELLSRTLGETIEIEVVRELGLWPCRVDPGQLENAILNLAINARDAMRGGGKLRIDSGNATVGAEFGVPQSELSAGEYVRVTVSDTGIGMAPQVLEHVFEPFFTTKDVGQGSGLGLSMVYGFVKQSGGHVSIQSQPGAGTTVRIYLPSACGAQLPDGDFADTADLPRGQGECVLVVEDDGDLRALIRVMLQALGYRVQEAESGAAAIALLPSLPAVDLLLTDVVLPGGASGPELAERLWLRRPELPVLFMSGYTADALAQHAGLDGRARLLQKPFRMAEIAQAVHKVLAGARSAHP